MTAVGIGMVFVGYSFALYGWILLRGYDIPFSTLFNGKPWPIAGQGASQPAA
jgi:hypothetical protein